MEGMIDISKTKELFDQLAQLRIIRATEINDDADCRFTPEFYEAFTHADLGDDLIADLNIDLDTPKGMNEYLCFRSMHAILEMNRAGMNQDELMKLGAVCAGIFVKGYGVTAENITKAIREKNALK